MNDPIGFRNLDMTVIASAAEAMSAVLNSLYAPGGLTQLIYPTVPCRFCGEEYRSVELFDLDRVCSDCRDRLDRIVRNYGVIRASDVEGLSDCSSRWTGQAIRYGRPWQEHVPAHSRHLIRNRA